MRYTSTCTSAWGMVEPGRRETGLRGVTGGDCIEYTLPLEPCLASSPSTPPPPSRFTTQEQAINEVSNDTVVSFLSDYQDPRIRCINSMCHVNLSAKLPNDISITSSDLVIIESLMACSQRRRVRGSRAGWSTTCGRASRGRRWRASAWPSGRSSTRPPGRADSPPPPSERSGGVGMKITAKPKPIYILHHYRTSCFLRVTWSWRLPLTGSFTITEMISA